MDLIAQRLAQLVAEHVQAVMAMQASAEYRRVLILEAAMAEVQQLQAALAAPKPADPDPPALNPLLLYPDERPDMDDESSAADG